MSQHRLKAQSTTILAVLDSASLEAQLEYLQQKTRVYDEFRAIREDVFLKAKKNALDSLNAKKLEVARLNSELSEKEFEIETLNTNLSRTKNERDQAIRNKGQFYVPGDGSPERCLQYHHVDYCDWDFLPAVFSFSSSLNAVML